MNRFLLDTHTLVWLAMMPDELPAALRRILARPDSDLLLSSVVCWEVAIKVARGIIGTRRDLNEFFDEQMFALGLHELPVNRAHALEIAKLPPIHGDPFDRLLIAQARVEGIPLVTKDKTIRRYDVRTLWRPE